MPKFMEISDMRRFRSNTTTGTQRPTLYFLGASIAIAFPLMANAQYAVNDSKTVKIVASFEDAGAAGTVETGLDAPWNYAGKRFSPHHWIWTAPQHSYVIPTISQSDAWWAKTNGSWENPHGVDNINWWHTLGSVDGTQGYSDNDYRLYIPELSNYQDWRGYDTLDIKWSGDNPKSGSVNLQVFARTFNPNQYYSLFYQTRPSQITQTEQISLASVPDGAKARIGDIKFRVFNTTIPGGTDYKNNFQRTHLFSAKLKKNTPDTVTYKSNEQRQLNWTSKFLGSVLHRRYGSYSASGFYDVADKKFKIWFGSGIPETESSDGIY